MLPTCYSLAPLNNQITRVERLSAESFISNHFFTDYCMYTYQENLLYAPTLPRPARYLDATHIMPKREFTPDVAGSYKAVELEFLFTVLHRHGGIWAASDYVLLDNLPEREFCVVQDTLYPVVMHLRQHSNFAHDALQCIKRVRKAASKQNQAVPIDKLMQVLTDLVPVTLKTYSARKALTLASSDDVFQQITNPELVPTLKNNFGVWLHTHTWIEHGCARNTQFSQDSLYEKLWNNFYGSRKPEPRVEKSRKRAKAAV